MSFLSRCCSNCIAFCIRHSVTYSSGVCPSSSLKRAANAERDMPAASARDSTVQRVFTLSGMALRAVPILRIENSTKPSFVEFWSPRDMRPEHLDKQNLGQPSRDYFRSRRLFFHL